jgi:hypothetical protein
MAFGSIGATLIARETRATSGSDDVGDAAKVGRGALLQQAQRER